MSRVFHLITILLFSITVMSLTGCGKSSEEKAKDAVNDYNTLANQINSMGTPSASWSDEELNRYENLLNLLEAKGSQVQGMNGEDGIVIYGTDNSSAIATNRQALANARAQKLRSQSESSKQEEMLRHLAKIKDGAREYDYEHEELVRAIPEDNASTADLQKFLERVDAHIIRNRKLHADANIPAGISYNPQVERSLQEIRNMLDADHSRLLQIKKNIINSIGSDSSNQLRAS